MNSSQPTQAAPGNRITFTSQQLPNGTINIGGAHGGSIISTSQLPNTTTIKTITSSAAGQQQQHHSLPQQVQVQHHQVLQSAGQQQGNPVGAGGNQQPQQSGGQPIINSMLPAGVVVGMRPPASQQQPKNVQGNTMGRVVVGGPHMVGTRPQSPAITLSTLTPGQTPALILKTENGYQLLRVGGATSGPVTQTIGTNSTNPTQIRLQTVPAASISNTSTANSIVVNSVANSSNSQPTHVYTSQANISALSHQQQTTTNVVTSMQHQQQQQSQQQQQFHTQTQHLQSQPQITQIQTIPAHQTSSGAHLQQTNQQQQHHTTTNNTTMNNVNSGNSGGAGTTTTTTPQSAAAQGNTKEKCRKFLANLIDLSTREPKPVEKNVRNLIQELVNANVEPEEFCDRLERLLNASPQPCLIGFLKKSLPLLRQALFTKELVIEGIKPPPQHVVGGITIQQQLPKIQAQIRPISQNQTTTIGQTQVRMIIPASASRPIGHTTITKQPTSGIRIQGPANGPRLINTQIRGPMSQPTTAQLQTQSSHANIVQIRAPTATQISRPATVQIRTSKAKNTTTPTASPGAGITHVKVGQTQIKAISSSPSPAISSQPPSLAAISNNVPTGSSLSSSASILSTINSVASNSVCSVSGLPIPSLPTVQLPPAVLAQQQQQQQQLQLNSTHSLISTNTSSSSSLDHIKTEIKGGSIATIISAPSTPTQQANKAPAKTSTASVNKAAAKKKRDLADKDRDELKINNTTSAASSAASFFQQPSISMSSYGDDDINDVAAMGGVNLAEETQRILGCTENIGTQIRSCKDEVFLHLPALQARIRAMVMERGLEEPSQDVAVLISHACQERLKNIVEKLAVIAEHRIDVIKLDPRYEVTKDVRGQIKFLEELDKAEQKRHEELEREMLLRAAKSRSKVEDPEQAKMKARAKEMQRAEMEELRQRDANMTALQAIGPRKKLKLDGDGASSGLGTGASNVLGTSGTPPAPLRPRIKRVNLRDMLFFMEQERETCRSQMLYKAYLK
ncbi:transcription initiation factor TFIID subunit 4 isoform X2 [Musca domestica]|uniref:Transcription initiation factor TFIID subunit 4 isoform X2 n=1 Tax=Musca domestica TaxID=7370 RepID=A0A1I8NGV9_MUSDO|nr:transcription initiation factor TFIID subunit 4 isoform X2 [Musca domestica]